VRGRRAGRAEGTHPQGGAASWIILLAAILFGLAACGAGSPSRAGQAGLSFSGDNVGEPGSGRAAELFLPQGAGPFPAVIVMHGCDGVTSHARAWARRLVGWGYAALVVDSFKPRGIENVCNRGVSVPPGLRARDAFAATAYLRSLSAIDADRIGLIGFSHGAWAALFAATERAKGDGPGFQAVVAFYPSCPKAAPKLAADLLILIGDADDWTPAGRCVDFVAKYGAGARHRPQLKLYPGATHAFDGRRPDRVYFGHHLAYDPEASADAASTRRFFDERLRR
jgi:dienelactone hydrolase